MTDFTFTETDRGVVTTSRGGFTISADAARFRGKGKHVVATVTVKRRDALVFTDEVDLTLEKARAAFVIEVAAKIAEFTPDADTGDFGGALLALLDALGEMLDSDDWADDGDDANDGGGGSVATKLVELAAGWELSHTSEDESFATFEVDGHRETWALDSRRASRFLRQAYYTKYESAPSSQAVTDAIGTLYGQALFDGEEREVYVRLAWGEHHDRIYLDLCNDAWQAVVIDADGWRVTDQVPVLFRRSSGMKALPLPEEGGTLADLDPFLNVTKEQRPLVRAALVQMFCPYKPYPVLIFIGEQGSAKSSSGRYMRLCVDPNTALLRRQPSSGRDLMISARNSWVIGIDNASSLKDWLSDDLCRLSTGGGMATRTLYEDTEEQLWDVQRPVILNGIDNVASRSDLLDRAIIVDCPVIPEAERRTEQEMDAEFAEAQPRILGALLTAASTALRNRGGVQLDTKPRMADFAVWATAAEPALGLAPGAFMKAYTVNRDEIHELAIEHSPVATALRTLIDTTGSFSGTATELKAALESCIDDRLRNSKLWPQSARAVAGELRRLTPNLRAIGYNVDYWRTAQRRGWTISK